MTWEGPVEFDWINPDNHKSVKISQCYINKETQRVKYFVGKLRTPDHGYEINTLYPSFIEKLLAAFENNSQQKNPEVCSCSMQDLMNGHDLNCPERGITLAKWQSKRYRY